MNYVLNVCCNLVIWLKICIDSIHTLYSDTQRSNVELQ